MGTDDVLRRLNRTAIERLLPHRHPFLFLDGATVLGPDEATGHFSWPEDHPIFGGHFPQRPVVPGVCHVEAIAQLGGILVALKARSPEDPSGLALGVLASIRSAAFRRIVTLGEVVSFRATSRQLTASSFLITGRAAVPTGGVCDAELLIVVKGNYRAAV